MDTTKPLWKISLAVWLPVLTVLAIGGLIYGVAAITAHNGYRACEAGNSANNPSTAADFAPYDCKQNMHRNRLGLPFFVD